MFKLKGARLLILTFFLGVVIIGLGYRLNYPYPNDPYQSKTYRLAQVKSALQRLEADRMIYSAKIISWLLTLTGYDKKLQKGMYDINNRMTVLEIIRKWQEGNQKHITVTVKEGDDLFDVGKTLVLAGLLKKEDDWLPSLDKKLLTWAQHILGLTVPLLSLEGFLYPDTYHLFVDDLPKKFIELALFQFREQVMTHLPSNLSDQKKLALFTIASLVEKETSVPSERPLVASVIYNRLKINMKLRFDPTIIYSLKVSGQYYANFKDGFVNIKKEHYGLKSPFNTYYVRGIPIGPISSFSLSSLKAVLNPAETNYLFFVAKKKGAPQEGHYFTTNYEDHLKYLKKMLKTR